MVAPIMEVLPSDSGQDLPHLVRRNLVDLGVAANQVALAVNQAALLELQQHAVRDAAVAVHRRENQITNASALLGRAISDYQDHLIVAYTIVSARYAVYAAGVATEIAARGQPFNHDLPDVLPSTVIRSLDVYLPPLSVTANMLHSSALADQNRSIAEARETLVEVIKDHLYRADLTEYDSTAAPPRPPGSQDLVGALPEALHEYAGQLTWAIGVVTGNGDDGD